MTREGDMRTPETTAAALATRTGRERAPSPDRMEDVAQERRRRSAGSLDRTAHLKMAVPPEIQSKYGATHHLHWFNDEGNRLYAMTVQDDYDKVPEVEPIPVGTSKDGKPIMAHLCMKPLDYYRADQGEKQAMIQEQEQALMRGKLKADGDNTSVAHEANRISRNA